MRHPYYVMQFDHVGDGKVGNVSRLLRTKGLNTVLGEIRKCEVVCAKLSCRENLAPPGGPSQQFLTVCDYGNEALKPSASAGGFFVWPDSMPLT